MLYPLKVMVSNSGERLQADTKNAKMNSLYLQMFNFGSHAFVVSKVVKTEW